MKFLYVAIVALFVSQGALVASSKFLGNSGMVDIGRNQESIEHEVPKEVIEKEPQVETQPNRVVYRPRVQSEKFDCETDFLGTETCVKQRTECPSFSDYSDGYSVRHHRVKTSVKLCQDGLLQSGTKCYLDENVDGVADNKQVTKTVVNNLPAYIKQTGDYYYCNKYGTRIDTGKPICAWSTAAKVLDCLGTRYVSGYSTAVIEECENSVLGEGTYLRLGRNSIYYNFRCFGSDGHHWGENSVLPLSRGPNGCINKKVNYVTETQCPSGFQIDGKFCYKKTFCPSGYEPQADGSCKMEYDWFSYTCPTDSNTYGAQWRVIDGGVDCGHKNCANSTTPPANNCVRLNYSCPIDPSLKCGKTLNVIGTCEDGYRWNNNRCEREESYCGDSFYNSILDICQNITVYVKKCKYDNEIYNSSTNECESNSDACLNGFYDSSLKRCVSEPAPDCEDGYEFNKNTGICENTSKSLCENQYSFDGTSCVGEMTVCESGMTYNEETKKCEEVVCGVNASVDLNGRCEADSPCVGVVSNGKCIPDRVQ